MIEMLKSFLPLCSAVIAASHGVLPILTTAQSQDPKPKVDFEKEIVPIVKASCLGCHNKDNAKHNVAFPDKMTLEDAKKNARLWKRAAREVKSGHMPPRNHGTMSDKDKKKFADWAAETFPPAPAGGK